MEISQKSRSSAFFGHLQVQKEGNTGPLKTSLGRGQGQLSTSSHNKPPPALPLLYMLDGHLLPFSLGLSIQNGQCVTGSWDWARGHAAG